MAMESRQLDKQGKLKEFWEMQFILPPGGGDEDWEMISAYKDGIPATDKELKDHEKGMGADAPGGYFDGVERLALDPDEAERVIPVNTGKTVNKDGERHHLYTFTHTYESGAVTEGELLISEDGYPVKIDYEFTNLPFYMQKMTNSFTFSKKGEAAIIDDMWMEGQVSVIFFKMHFLSKISFGEYRKRKT